MLKRIFIVPIASALLVATVYAHEPGGFNGRLYGAEVAVGGAITLAPVIWGGLAKASFPYDPDDKYSTFAIYVTSTYPLLMGLGTFLVGEICGASSENKKACYLIPTSVTLGVTAGAAFLGSCFTSNRKDGALVGEWVSIVPNAFLTACLYNVVKKPKDENAGASISISPYFNASCDPGTERDFTVTCGIVASY
jgi:hypothetical protein